MKLRTLVLTVAVLAVLSAVAYYLQRPEAPPAADARLGQPVIDQAHVEQAQKLSVADQGKTVTLARQPDGTWRVTSYYDLPADFQKLSRFIGDLTEAKIQRVVTSNPERLARLDFKDTKIELFDTAGHSVWSLDLGKNAEVGGGRFVRYGTEQKAYLASLNAWLDTEPKNWADAQLLNLKPDDVASVEIPLPDGPLAISRGKKDEPWAASKTPNGERVKADKVAALLGALDGIRFTDTLEPADPKIAEAKPHTRTFKLTTFDHKSYTLAFARKPEEKKLKVLSTAPDAKSGPAALGALADLTKKNAASGKPGDKTPAGPDIETIPAGKVYLTIASSDASAPINALMQKRGFEVNDYSYTGLPDKAADLFEPIPVLPAATPMPAVPAAAKPADTKK